LQPWQTASIRFQDAD
jgi:hypothetical protein